MKPWERLSRSHVRIAPLGLSVDFDGRDPRVREHSFPYVSKSDRSHLTVSKHEYVRVSHSACVLFVHKTPPPGVLHDEFPDAYLTNVKQMPDFLRSLPKNPAYTCNGPLSKQWSVPGHSQRALRDSVFVFWRIDQLRREKLHKRQIRAL